MSGELSGTLLLDPQVIKDPYPFYRRLQTHAPVWQVPATDVFIVSSFAMAAEATGRVEDFSSNMHCLLYRDDDGLPNRLTFGSTGMDALATADPPIHTLHGLSGVGGKTEGCARAGDRRRSGWVRRSCAGQPMRRFHGRRRKRCADHAHQPRHRLQGW